MLDPDTGEAVDDETVGPTHGFGWGDLGIAGRATLRDLDLEISRLDVNL